MSRAAEYRRYSVACLESAKHSTDEDAKQDLLKLAELWLKLASLAGPDEKEATTASFDLMEAGVPPQAIPKTTGHEPC
jgi:hypothetical protein